MSVEQPARPKRGQAVFLNPAWSEFYRALNQKCWSAMAPLARYCISEGLAPCDVDETTLLNFCKSAAASGCEYADELGERVRRACAWLATNRPDVAKPSVNASRKRATPRADQWSAIPAALRQDIAAWQQRENAPRPKALEAERNLLLRVIAGAAAAGIEISSLEDLTRIEALETILPFEMFGALDQPNHTRSKFLECLAAYSRMRNLPDATNRITHCLRQLPRRCSPVRIEDIEAVEELAQPETLQRIVAQTETIIQTFAERPNRRLHQAAQTALAIRVVLATTHTRQELINAKFDGPACAAGLLRRPTLWIGSSNIEATATHRTIHLIDEYYRGCGTMGREPVYLIEHFDGSPRDDTTLSEAVRRFGCDLGIELTISRLVLLTVYLLLAQGEDIADPGMELMLQQHLNIDQIGNLRARYGLLIDEKLFARFAAKALANQNVRIP